MPHIVLTLPSILQFAKILLHLLRESFVTLQTNELSSSLSTKIERYSLNLQQRSGRLTHVQFHVQYFASEYVITVLCNYINFFLKNFEIPSVYKWSHIKTTGLHKGNSTTIDIKPFTCNNIDFSLNFKWKLLKKTFHLLMTMQFNLYIQHFKLVSFHIFYNFGR